MVKACVMVLACIMVFVCGVVLICVMVLTHVVNTCLPFCVMVWYYGDNPGNGISLCCGVSPSYHVSPVMV